MKCCIINNEKKKYESWNYIITVLRIAFLNSSLNIDKERGTLSHY